MVMLSSSTSTWARAFNPKRQNSEKTRLVSELSLLEKDTRFPNDPIPPQMPQSYPSSTKLRSHS